jgi:hypothetical protein
MTTQKLKQYIDKVLGNNIRCLLPSYWWKRLFGLVVDKVEEVDTKITNLPTKKYVNDAVSNVSIAVDDIMSEYSENPVQNKVIKEYVDSKEYGTAVFVVGINDSTGDVYLSEEDIAQNKASYAKIKNKVPCRGTINFYTTDGTSKTWFYSITCTIVVGWHYAYSFANIRIMNVYVMAYFANQPIDVILGDNGSIEIYPSTGLLQHTALFINTTSAVYVKHNRGIYELMNLNVIIYPVYSLIEVNTNGTALFPATYERTKNSDGSISFNIDITKNDVKIRYSLNSDGTLTEIQ